MSNYLDSKIDELLEINLSMKRHFQHVNKADTPGYDHKPIDGRTMLQLETLRFLGKNKDCAMKDIADYLKVSMSSATQLIERLVHDNLVKRIDDTSDRRIIRLEISDEGKNQLNECNNHIKEKLKRIYSILTEDELNQFIKIVRKIIENF